MPKVDLTKLQAAKLEFGPLSAMKGAGWSWEKPEEGLPTALDLRSQAAGAYNVTLQSIDKNSVAYTGRGSRCYLTWDMAGKPIPNGTRMKFKVLRGAENGGRFIVRASDRPEIYDSVTYYDNTAYGSFWVSVDVTINSHPIHNRYFGFLTLGTYPIEIREFQLIYP